MYDTLIWYNVNEYNMYRFENQKVVFNTVNCFIIKALTTQNKMTHNDFRNDNSRIKSLFKKAYQTLLHYNT